MSLRQVPVHLMLLANKYPWKKINNGHGVWWNIGRPPPTYLHAGCFCFWPLTLNPCVVPAETSDWFHSRHIPGIHPAQPAWRNGHEGHKGQWNLPTQVKIVLTQGACAMLWLHGHLFTSLLASHIILNIDRIHVDYRNYWCEEIRPLNDLRTISCCMPTCVPFVRFGFFEHRQFLLCCQIVKIPSFRTKKCSHKVPTV